MTTPKNTTNNQLVQSPGSICLPVGPTYQMTPVSQVSKKTKFSILLISIMMILISGITIYFNVTEGIYYPTNYYPIGSNCRNASCVIDPSNSNSTQCTVNPVICTSPDTCTSLPQISVSAVSYTLIIGLFLLYARVKLQNAKKNDLDSAICISLFIGFCVSVAFCAVLFRSYLHKGPVNYDGNDYEKCGDFYQAEYLGTLVMFIIILSFYLLLFVIALFWVFCIERIEACVRGNPIR